MTQNSLQELSKKLRLHQTDAEKIVWRILRNNQLGCKFRRQHPVGDHYIVDFICLEKKLIIEIDGGQHNVAVDADRTTFLENEGFIVMRFWNNDVMDNPDGVYQIIFDTVNA